MDPALRPVERQQLRCVRHGLTLAGNLTLSIVKPTKTMEPEKQFEW